MKTLFALLLCCCFFAWNGAGAETPLPGPQEVRLKALARDLRCLVCQNESLAESHAPLAADLREEIRAQMRSGQSDQEIVAYLVARYGDFVTYRPPFNFRTYLLWLGPLAVLLLLLASLWSHLRRHRIKDKAAVTRETHDVHQQMLRLKRQYGDPHD